jgi:translation initiation factor eIF-2B subunit delta
VREDRSHLPDGVLSALERIASDNRSGAAEILRRGADLFALLDRELSRRSQPGGESLQETINSLSIALALAQPGMSTLIRLSNEVMKVARAGELETVVKSSADAAARFVEKATRGANAAASHAASLIDDGARVLTHSRSSTVLEAFAQARRAGKNFSVVATESRPMLEGRTLARALVEEGVRVSLVIDAAAAMAIEEVDLVFVGADAITPASVVNKVGTRMIALAARERSVPIFAVCDTSKFIREDCLAEEREHPSAELWPDAPTEVSLTNRYFESTPLAYFTRIITEDGPWSSEEVARRAEDESIDNMLLEALNAEREIK